MWRFLIFFSVFCKLYVHSRAHMKWRGAKTPAFDMLESVLQNAYHTFNKISESKKERQIPRCFTMDQKGMQRRGVGVAHLCARTWRQGRLNEESSLSAKCFLYTACMPSAKEKTLDNKDTRHLRLYWAVSGCDARQLKILGIQGLDISSPHTCVENWTQRNNVIVC
jgi:hypothetical protein